MPSTQTSPSQSPFLPQLRSIFSAWLKAPAQVASVCPSSGALTYSIADRDCVREADVVVDLGPGTGGTSQALLKHMHPHSRLLAIELTAEFLPALRAIRDPRLIVQQGDAENLADYLSLHQLPAPAVVVSGLPFSAIPDEAARRLLKVIKTTLQPNGTFIAYQVRDAVASYAAPELGVDYDVDRVWWNLPPLKVFTWKKA